MAKLSNSRGLSKIRRNQSTRKLAPSRNTSTRKRTFSLLRGGLMGCRLTILGLMGRIRVSLCRSRRRIMLLECATRRGSFPGNIAALVNKTGKTNGRNEREVCRRSCPAISIVSMRLLSRWGQSEQKTEAERSNISSILSQNICISKSWIKLSLPFISKGC